MTNEKRRPRRWIALFVSDRPAKRHQTGIAYHEGDLDMNNYNLTIDGGTVSIGRAKTRGLNVVHTAGRWEDGRGQTGLFLGWDTDPSTYELSGTGEVELGRMFVGRFAPGTFDQLGGSVLIDQRLEIAEGGGAAGSAYNLTSGTVTIGTVEDTAGLLLIGSEGTFNFLGTGLLKVQGDVQSDVNDLIDQSKITGVTSEHVWFDGTHTNVHIPEPDTWLLLVLSAFACGLLLRFRRHASARRHGACSTPIM